MKRAYCDLLCHVRMQCVRHSRTREDSNMTKTCSCLAKSADNNNSTSDKLLDAILVSESIKQYGIIPPTRTNQLCLDVYIHMARTTPQDICSLLEIPVKQYTVNNVSPVELRLQWFRKVWKCRSYIWPAKRDLIIEYAFLFPNGTGDPLMKDSDTSTIFERSQYAYKCAREKVEKLFKSDAELVSFFKQYVLDVDAVQDSEERREIVQGDVSPWTKNVPLRPGSDNKAPSEQSRIMTKLYHTIKGPCVFPLRPNMNSLEKQILLAYLQSVNYTEVVKDVLRILENGQKYNVKNVAGTYFNCLVNACVASKNANVLTFLRDNPLSEFRNVGGGSATVARAFQIAQTYTE